jgi:hypothetical protein
MIIVARREIKLTIMYIICKPKMSAQAPAMYGKSELKLHAIANINPYINALSPKLVELAMIE